MVDDGCGGGGLDGGGVVCRVTHITLFSSLSASLTLDESYLLFYFFYFFYFSELG